MTTCGYDFRNRLETADGEIDFFEKYFYDNQDRLTKTERRDTTSAGTLLAQSETKYDDLGRVFQSLQYSVTSGSAGNSLKEKIWYSPTGQVIKRVPMGTQAFQKMQYDGVGRVTKSFVCFDPNELDTNYSAADDVEYDTVLRQIENTYDAASNLIQVTTRNRFHDATLTGELTSPGGAQPKARVSYLAFYPDALGRMVEVADYGTNGASSFSRSDTKPAGSDLILVSQTAYNTRGEAFQFTDPKGIVTLRGFDDAGRVFQKVEDRYGVVRTTDFTHTADSQLATLTAVNGVTGNQTTTWTYGTTLSDSDVASNDLLRFEQYPDGSSSDRVEYKYNRLGEVKEIKAQNGTVRSLKYDKLGRLEHDCADTLGSNVDGAVRRLTRSYEARGLLEKLTSYDNATPGSGSVVNEVKYEYNGFMLLTKESQSHQGAVTSSTPAVQYGYTDGSNNHARRITCTSPDGTVLEYDYGYPNSADDALNRVEYLKSGTAMGVDYSYLGIDQIVICSYSCEPSVELTYFTPGQTGEAGDQYTGLDRFGRVIDQRWRKTSDDSDRERVKYGFDRLSNRKWRQQATPAASGKEQDEYYTYDGLSQVKSLLRGALTGNPPSGISSPAALEEGWNFDPTGNWHGTEAEGFAYRIQEGGGTTLNQNRTHTVANEIESITRTTGSNWPTPSYDALGSFITTPQPLAPVNEYKLKWDAWSRMVEVRLTDDSFVGAWSYDGGNRRVSKLTGAEMRHYYYSDQWQVLEERTGSNNYADRRFIWGIRGVDDLVCRDQWQAGKTERLYALNDPANVTAIVDVNGAVQERYGYDGFGAVRYLDANFQPPTEPGRGWETLFSSYRYDQDTGLYLPRERILHSKLGRFLSRDRVGYASGTNLYGNVGNAPMNLVDPFGLQAEATQTERVLLPDQSNVPTLRVGAEEPRGSDQPAPPAERVTVIPINGTLPDGRRVVDGIILEGPIVERVPRPRVMLPRTRAECLEESSRRFRDGLKFCLRLGGTIFALGVLQSAVSCRVLLPIPGAYGPCLEAGIGKSFLGGAAGLFGCFLVFYGIKVQDDDACVHLFARPRPPRG